MSNERLKAFKERVKTDPEYRDYIAECRRKRYRERMQTDPEYRAIRQANWVRKASKRKAKLLTTPERIEIHQQFKLNQFKKSIMNEEQLKEHRKQQKAKSFERFEAKHGIKYSVYEYWRRKSGLRDVQAIIEYRDKHKPVINYCNRGERFKAKYGVTIWEWGKVYKPLGYTLKTLLERKYQLERKRLELESLKAKPQPIIQAVSYTSNPKPKIKLPMQLTKQQAYTEMQNKISNLNCVITIPEIRDAKINQLQIEFNNIYGAV